MSLLKRSLPTFRVGHGYDVHAFEAARPLILGGVEIPYAYGLKAHSDGDAVIHAICDALLGAAALGDIGQHFPDTCASHKGKSSEIFLKSILKLLQKDHWQISNVDVTIVAQVPKLAPHMPQMTAKLAQILQVERGQINVKATTTEGMGYLGRKEGIAVHAVALIGKR